MKDKLFYYLGIYGEKIGVGLIILVSLWDFFFTGFRGFFEYNISYITIYVHRA